MPTEKLEPYLNGVVGVTCESPGLDVRGWHLVPVVIDDDWHLPLNILQASAGGLVEVSGSEKSGAAFFQGLVELWSPIGVMIGHLACSEVKGDECLDGTTGDLGRVPLGSPPVTLGSILSGHGVSTTSTV